MYALPVHLVRDGSVDAFLLRAVSAFTYKNYGIGQAQALILFVVCAIVGVTQVYSGKKGEVAA